MTTEEKLKTALQILREASGAFDLCGDHAIPYYIGDLIKETLTKIDAIENEIPKS